MVYGPMVIDHDLYQDDDNDGDHGIDNENLTNGENPHKLVTSLLQLVKITNIVIHSHNHSNTTLNRELACTYQEHSCQLKEAGKQV